MPTEVVVSFDPVGLEDIRLKGPDNFQQLMAIAGRCFKIGVVDGSPIFRQGPPLSPDQMNSGQYYLARFDQVKNAQRRGWYITTDIGMVFVHSELRNRKKMHCHCNDEKAILCDVTLNVVRRDREYNSHGTVEKKNRKVHVDRAKSAEEHPNPGGSSSPPADRSRGYALAGPSSPSVARA